MNWVEKTKRLDKIAQTMFDEAVGEDKNKLHIVVWDGKSHPGNFEVRRFATDDEFCTFMMYEARFENTSLGFYHPAKNRYSRGEK